MSNFIAQYSPTELPRCIVGATPLVSRVTISLASARNLPPPPTYREKYIELTLDAYLFNNEYYHQIDGVASLLLLLLLLLLLFLYLFHGSAIAGVHGDIKNHGVLFKVKTFVESFVLETRIR